MFPSKFPLLVALQTFLVFVAVVLTLTLTGNPLAIMGLWFLPSAPFVGDPSGDSEEKDAAIGFTADVN